MPDASKRRKTKHVEAAGDRGAVGSETIDNAEVTGAAMPVSSAEPPPKAGKKRGGSGTPAKNLEAAAELIGEGEKEEELSAKRGRGSQPRSQRDPSVSDSVELITEDTIEQLRKENAKLKEENKALREVSSRLLRQQAKTNVMLVDAFNEQKRFVIKLASDTKVGFETLKAELSSLRPVEQQTVDEEGESKEKESKAAKKDESGAEACGEGIGESEKASSETGAGADKEQQGGSEGTEGGHDETNRQRDVPMFRGGARARGTPPARMFGAADDFDYGGYVGERYEGPRGAYAKTTASGSGSVRRRCMGGLGRVAEGGAAADSVTIIRKETTTEPVHGRSGREVLGTPDTTLGELEEIGVKELVAAKGEEAGA
jgi:hypothetical protein